MHHAQAFSVQPFVSMSPHATFIVQCYLPCHCSALNMVSSCPCRPIPSSLQYFFLPESLQPNLTLGSQTWVTPSQLFSSLESMQSVSPSQRHLKGMHRPSSRHWNSSLWQPPGGLVAAGAQMQGIRWGRLQVSHFHLRLPNAPTLCPV